MSYFYNADLKLNYEIIGTGQPLILIAGITCDHNHWLLIKDDLSQFFQVIMLDNRGVGYSDTPNSGYLIEDMALDVVRLLDHLNIEKSSILGHSMGGAVAQYLGSFFSSRVKNLIISHSFIKFRASSLMFCEHDYLLQKECAKPEIMVGGILPFVYSDDFIANQANVANFMKALQETPSSQSLISYRQQINAICAFDSRGFIQDIIAPTLVIAGEFDKLTPPQDSQEIAKLIPNSQLSIISGAHVPMWEIPKEYVNLIFNFMGIR